MVLTAVRFSRRELSVTKNNKDMQTLINLIWSIHGTGINSVLTAVECGDNPEYEISALLAALLADDTFSEYTDKELSAAISEIINEY